MLFFLIGCLGLCWGLMYAKLFAVKVPRTFLASRFSFFNELFKCSKCIGFWCGVSMSLFLFYMKDETLTHAELIILPFASSAFCWFVDSTLDFIQDS